MKLARTLVPLALAGSLVACSQMNAPAFKGTAVIPPQRAADFTLTDGDSTPWSLQDQHGKIVVLFFGYTHCTDVCPLTLASLTHAVDTLGPAKKDVEIAFVTVDPQRDSPAVLSRYAKLFGDAKIIGLTGTQAQLEPAYHAYHVWSQKIPGNGSSYQMAHSSAVYFIDKEGYLRVVHSWNDSTASFAHDLKELTDGGHGWD